MNEGIDEFDEFDDEYGQLNVNDTVTPDDQILKSEDDPIDDTIQDSNDDSDDNLDNLDNEGLILSLLKSKGIEDISKIKFENDEGEIDEVDWNSLSSKDKLNILNSSLEEKSELDASEMELINAIRNSQLTPAEYVQYLQRVSVENYIQNTSNEMQTYSVDQYSDDELYVMDLINRTNDITQEEAEEALERAKSNEALFKKQIGAIRNEYKKAEEESLQYAKLKQEQEAQEQFNQFAESIENSIINFKEFSGCELNMSNEDMQDLYSFITGTDNAGNNWFSKALNDSDSIVQMAWFLLNGEKMIQDINEYYQREITNVRKESYNKGLKDAAKKDTTTVAYKPKGKSKSSQEFDDLDDF